MQKYFFIIFTISGFAGLIYESIWAHYLKLFLGHAAYAQTLVLAIFMGGMAIGAWICSRYGSKWPNLLLAYAIAEAIIGIAALIFHPIFESSIQLAYNTLFPAIDSANGVALLKWFIAALLILPQSILLGMTFPLMTAGVMRSYPQSPGKTIAGLYFCNSIGAAIGVLVSGFWLIDSLGLPGTIQTAGIINILIAFTVWQLVKNQQTSSEDHGETIAVSSEQSRQFKLLLGVAALTGAASFIYEIVWLRMLSLVLGSSTHAFELMLSAFILGLALGGLWIRSRIERIDNVIKTLAMVQLAMGVLALATLPVYDATFSVMQWLTNSLPKTDSGYFILNVSSQAIAMVVMLPATILAGMTLPLITYTLFNNGHRERSIGAVYSANTVGAIVGIFFATHIGMPALGLKGLLATGAAIDMCLAVFLFAYLKKDFDRRWVFGSAVTVAVSLGFTALFLDMDIYKMSSGVYRTGKLLSADNTEILFHQDGKVATVDLQRDENGYVNIRTNGKVDANINMNENGPVSPDEPTMVLAAAIPMAYLPNAQTAAVIGMGSGLTTHTLLSNLNMESVDTIEIEPAMVEAAKGFRPRVERAYSDPRSHIYIDDAKTYFSNHNKSYDIIISEPSNPWVSGTASLFSEEFYRFLPKYMQKDGILVQWMQLYELNIELVASVIKALSKHFKYYVIYAATDYDILITASNSPLNNLTSRPFEITPLRKELNKIYISNRADFELRKVADKKSIAALINSYALRSNSDYYPVLGLGAAKARFMGQTATSLVSSSYAALPVKRLIDNQQPLQFGQPTRTDATLLTLANFSQIALGLKNKYLYNRDYTVRIPMKYQTALKQLVEIFINCDPVQTAVWIDTLLDFTAGTQPFLNHSDMKLIWNSIQNGNCSDRLSAQQQDWLSLLDAIGQRQFKQMAGIAEWLLKHDVATKNEHRDFLLSAALLGHYMGGNNNLAIDNWEKYRDVVSKDFASKINQRLLLSNIGVLPQYNN
ncbi:MAG: fused MFS/spermidine synthase [Thiohalomonadales bacterium]